MARAHFEATYLGLIWRLHSNCFHKGSPHTDFALIRLGLISEISMRNRRGFAGNRGVYPMGPFPDPENLENCGKLELPGSWGELPIAKNESLD